MGKQKRIIATSDLHGDTPEIPDSDLLILGGDYCPYNKDQHWWYRDTFNPWLKEIAERMPIIMIAGNHDFIFEKYPHLLPRMPVTYLQNSETEIFGLKFWGSPCTPRFHDWAFNLDSNELIYTWNQIPKDTDVLITHGPPFGIGDRSHHSTRTGCHYLLESVFKISPKIHIFGHNHEGYGYYSYEKTEFYNVSRCNRDRHPVNPPVEIIIETR